MPKNTGRGSRNASQTSDKPDTTWIKRNTSAGVFTEAKARGGDFRGIIPADKRNQP